MNPKLNLQKSAAAYAKAKRLMPGGVNSAARAFGAVGGEPIVFDRGEGAYLYDIDGNRYIDYIGSWGPMILGHQFPAVKDAVHAAVEKGTSFGAPTVAENELAELIVEMVASVEMVRLVNSGTEATMSAIRVARGHTNRDLIVKFSGNYHGHVDSLLVAAGSSAATLAVPNSPGVTPGTSQDTLILRYNDSEGLDTAFEKYGNKIACVILEPICGNMGVVVAEDAFLKSLKANTQKYGSVLIFDEVMCGFRVSSGGAQQLLGIEPDMTTMGKIVGGGLPLGAFGGRKEIMQNVLPAGRVFQAGTLSGNPIATAAGIAMLRALRDNPPYSKLDELTKRMETGVDNVLSTSGLPYCINRVGSMMTLFFASGPINDWDSASRSDTEMFSKYFWNLIHQGVYMPCSQFESLFVSATHTEEDIDATIKAIANFANKVSDACVS